MSDQPSTTKAPKAPARFTVALTAAATAEVKRLLDVAGITQENFRMHVQPGVSAAVIVAAQQVALDALEKARQEIAGRSTAGLAPPLDFPGEREED
jgi:hypothetical protein